MTLSQWRNLAKRQETREVTIPYALSRVRASILVVTTGGTVLSHVEFVLEKQSDLQGWLARTRGSGCAVERERSGGSGHG